MYDEFERAVTGRSGARLSLLGWVSIALGTLFVLGIVGAGLAFFYVRSQVSEVAQVIREEMAIRPTLAAEAVMERMESHASLLDVSPEEGVMMLRDLGSGPPEEAFMREVFGGSLDLFPEGDAFVEGLKDQARESVLDIQSDEGRVRMDLVRGEDGGSLVIESDEGQVRFDLQKTDRGGFLAIDSDEGQVRFDLIKGEDGGSLIIQSDEGQVRFDVQGGEEGGTLVIQTDETSIRFAAGDEAEAMPRWVRRMDGMPRDPERVYSLATEEGFMGAVAWEGNASPRDILSFYREWLEGEGFQIRSESRYREEGRDQVSLWAREEGSGRVVFLVAGEDEGGINVLLGYGEREG